MFHLFSSFMRIHIVSVSYTIIIFWIVKSVHVVRVCVQTTLTYKKNNNAIRMRRKSYRQLARPKASKKTKPLRFSWPSPLGLNFLAMVVSRLVEVSGIAVLVPLLFILGFRRVHLVVVVVVYHFVVFFYRFFALPVKVLGFIWAGGGWVYFVARIALFVEHYVGLVVDGGRVWYKFSHRFLSEFTSILRARPLHFLNKISYC